MPEHKADLETCERLLLLARLEEIEGLVDRSELRGTLGVAFRIVMWRLRRVRRQIEWGVHHA